MEDILPKTRSRNEVYLKSAEEIDAMRRAGHLLGRVIKEVVGAAVEGVTTLELDKIAYSRIKEAGATPGFLGLYDFPNTLCISMNEEVVHGIPGKRKLVSGDIVSIDCGVILDGFFADRAYTVGVGKISEEAARLLEVTRESLRAGIAAAKVGGRVGDIGAAIEKTVKRGGFHVVEDYTGHGIGRKLHEDPKVFNNGRERGRRIGHGLTLAIEPMVNVGTGATEELKDGWTVVSKDRSLSAHFEHTVAVTRDGVEILTECPEDPMY
ncbi:MAG: type I methionyl aminopeptidase [Candidatus Sumerlaeia bacterium]|nr:type I methionyl aminopeptidase [Candidatus Sumerlaeia bacterium]